MILPWSIGQVFVQIGAGAMPVLVLVTLVANLLVILFFLSRPAMKLKTA
jgi:hypothetical protein